MIDVNVCLNEAEEKMDMAIMYLDESLAHIRAGKANVRILDGIRVDSYGSMVPLNNVAAISTPDARTIAIKPWDKNMIAPIEKAIIVVKLSAWVFLPSPKNVVNNWPSSVAKRLKPQKSVSAMPVATASMH